MDELAFSVEFPANRLRDRLVGARDEGPDGTSKSRLAVNGGLLGLDESVVELWLPITHGASSVETGCPNRVSKNWD